MQDATTVERIRRKYLALSSLMDERMRRQWAAAEATARAVFDRTGLTAAGLVAQIASTISAADQRKAGLMSVAP